LLIFINGGKIKSLKEVIGVKTKIGFLDSGIGGVTVLRECIKLNPNFEYIYYSDSFNNPYGDKTYDELITIVDNIVVKLINKGCFIIVIACNTASGMCVNYLREKYKDVKFIAIEPAIKLVYDNGSSKNTLIMATKGTIDSDRFHLLYDKYGNSNCYLLSCVGLANLIETENISGIKEYLSDNLIKYKGKVSSVVLGCTHYPLIKKEISDVLGDVIFYDGSIGVANQLKRVINTNHFSGSEDIRIEFLDSSEDDDKKNRFFKILEEVDYE